MRATVSLFLKIRELKLWLNVFKSCVPEERAARSTPFRSYGVYSPAFIRIRLKFIYSSVKLPLNIQALRPGPRIKMGRPEGDGRQDGDDAEGLR